MSSAKYGPIQIWAILMVIVLGLAAPAQAGQSFLDGSYYISESIRFTAKSSQNSIKALNKLLIGLDSLVQEEKAYFKALDARDNAYWASDSFYDGYLYEFPVASALSAANYAEAAGNYASAAADLLYNNYAYGYDYYDTKDAAFNMYWANYYLGIAAYYASLTYEGYF